jgi:serine protease
MFMGTSFFALTISFNSNTIAQPTQVTYMGFQFAKFNNVWKVWDGSKFWDVSNNSLKLKFTNKPDSTGLVDFVSDYHLILRHESAMHYFYFEIDSGYDLMQTILALDTISNLNFLAPNITPVPYSVSNDYYYSNSSTNGYQWYLDQIGMPTAWTITQGSPNVTLALFGEGIDWKHEDLGFGYDNYHNFWTNLADTWTSPWPSVPPSGTPGDGIDNNPGLTYDLVDDYFGGNLTSLVASTSVPHWRTDPATSLGHETVAAGIIGAKTNNITGIAGIAGGWGTPGARLMAVSFHNSFNSQIVPAAIAPCIRYAVENGAAIINYSYGMGFINL